LNVDAQPALSAALECVSEGSRVLVVLGDDPKLVEALKLPEKSTIVALFDVHDVNLGKANGTPEVVPDGFPMIVLAPDGTPGITFMSGATAPTDTQIAVLKSGNGKTVTDKSDVTVAYSGWLWPTDGQAEPTQFDSTWAKNKTPATFSMAGGVIAGFSKALIGQKVGSQVEVIIAPADGYGATGQGAIPGNATLVFVIDILGVH
jgi:peptidylprolyl isomerase